MQRKNTPNFDETGFRTGWTKGQYLLVPDDLTEVSDIVGIAGLGQTIGL
jgi:hypothetical protein